MVTNQKSRQKATTSVEKYFFKLLNNSNFGIDCCNNIDNCILEKVYDDLAEISYIKKWMKELDAVESFEKSKNRRKRKFKDTDAKIEECQDPRKTKIVVEFNDHKSASIKSFAVKKRSSVKVTTRFISGKLLIFVKLSLVSFIYEVIETFCFPDENVRESMGLRGWKFFMC